MFSFKNVFNLGFYNLRINFNFSIKTSTNGIAISLFSVCMNFGTHGYFMVLFVVSK
ncbi:hypothetical protein AQPE_3212 [Aquipluma nitroreducens]|uniref:Uncharacterized protein n=1 Tax=Aquipluma nitroreducens TaxID=2010828 RepID=A0A5K7SC37_9BACT|nr:hypothetical protein AQPE_3212 [Aquipluma nitroreducens]